MSSLERMGHSVTWIQRDDVNARAALCNAIRSREFDFLLTWQRFYRMQHDVLEALSESAIQTMYMDFGFWPHYESIVFDSAGDNATSALREAWLNGGVAPSPAAYAAADALIDEHATKAARLQREHMNCLPADLRNPFVFVPLQRPMDSVIRYDSEVHDFGRLVRRVLALAAHRMFVVVKTHPLDRDLDLGVPDRALGRHVIIRQSFGRANEQVCDSLLSHAALVVGINSNMLFRAMLFGKPVIACGEGWYSGSGALTEVAGTEKLESLVTSPIDSLARRRYIAACLERQLTFAQLADTNAVWRVLNAVGIFNGSGTAATRSALVEAVPG